ncbi:MAG: hotdog fold thioesterase [Mucilaginibacter polytrichastri]|nr:hotdog fold thioesterase [Mucilaginibacter polytrichastri]
MIWNKEPDLQAWLGGRPKNISDVLGIEFTAIGDDFLEARMPVDERTRQPFGILHGGASVVLAETLGSVASNLVLDEEKWMGVGLEVNANHLRPVKEGFVTGVCRPVHLGSKTHVWDIRLVNDAQKLCCIARLTVAVVPRT